MHIIILAKRGNKSHFDFGSVVERGINGTDWRTSNYGEDLNRGTNPAGKRREAKRLF